MTTSWAGWDVMERSVRAFESLTDPMRYCLSHLQDLKKLEDRIDLLMMNQVTVAELQLWRMPEAAEELQCYLDGAEMSVALLYKEYERCATEVC